jgi:arginyl-tRNA synthetase
MKLLRLPETLEQSTVEMKPNVIADFLFTLANDFSSFYNECPVMKEENAEVKRSREALCLLTGDVLKFGLSLLGIEVVERM